MIPCMLVSLKQYVKFKKKGEVYLELIILNQCCGFRDDVLVV